MNGEGLVAWDYFVTVLLWIAAVLQIAVLRDRTIAESPQADACRWLIAAGLAGLAMRMSFILYDTGDVKASPFTLASVGMIALGCIGRPLELLMRPRQRRRCTDFGELGELGEQA